MTKRKIKVRNKRDNLTKEVKPEFKAKKKKWLAVVLKENKGCAIKWISFKNDSFVLDNNYYFSLPEGAYISDNRILISVYVEGISTPITHKMVEREEITKELDFGSDTQTVSLTVIKGLNYDSKVIDMLLTRKLADAFTRVSMDMPQFLLILLICISIGFSIANLGVLLS